MLYKLGGYYLIPHELLHVLGYWLIGKPCQYQWGDYCVRPLAQRTRNERLFIALLPFIICWGLGFFFYLLWLVLAISIQLPFKQYLLEAPRWHFLCPLFASLFIIYGGTAHGDLLTAYHLLFTKKELNDKSQETEYQYIQEL
ncbi:DUF3267 domain-containing protein [Anaerolineales bacterium HSG6]|nr:DUF3267 domain-containing protein [Anaerolineales bacterium HSG6]